MKHLVFIFLLFISTITLVAQTKDKGENIVGEDKRISTPFCSAVVGWTFPYGEMGERYKSFMNLNANFGWKTTSNFVWMLEFGFGFGGDNIKNKSEILAGLMTNDGTDFIISKEGSDAGVVAYNRNLSLVGKIGKIIPFSERRPNSGLLLMAGVGGLQHQIIYQSTLEIAEQLEGDYAYLYDRQMRGVMLSGFVGYMHMSKKSFTNFYIGIEFNQAWTKTTREYQINYDYSYDKVFQDRMWTIKAGWMFPFFGRDADKVYYY